MANSIKNISISTDSFSLFKQEMKQKVKELFERSDGTIKERIEIDIEPLNIIHWLNAQKSEQKIFWQNRNHSVQVAGIHRAYYVTTNESIHIDSLISEVYSICSHPRMRFYGGTRFNTETLSDSLWEDMGVCYFILPQIEIVVEDTKTIFVVNIVCENLCDRFSLREDILRCIDEIDFDKSSALPILDAVTERSNMPDLEYWKEMFRTVSKAFAEKEMDKIVLARKSSFSFLSEVNGLSLLDQLIKRQDNTYYFYFQLQPGKVFMGVPPERLYLRRKNCIWSEALAGTRVRHEDTEEDFRLGRELLKSTKDIHEHAIVVDNIREVFDKLCTEYEYDKEVRLMKLQNLQHLYCSFSGQLKDGIGDGTILSLLHPTAAVCGYPKKKNMMNIAKIECFDRGWFAGPMGCISKDEAEFSVAIRSSFIEKCKIHIFAGAGVVPQSKQQDEWNEIENKMNNLARLFCNESKIS